jgi:hypothetical protein
VSKSYLDKSKVLGIRMKYPGASPRGIYAVRRRKEPVGHLQHLGRRDCTVDLGSVRIF